MTPSSGHLSVALVYDGSLDRHGGVQQYLTMLGRGLSRRGVAVSFLVGGSQADRLGEAPVRSLAHNVPVRFNGSAGTMPLLSRRRRIEQTMAEGRFDVVHVQVPFSPLFAARAIRRLGPHTALVGTFHVYSERWPSRLGARALAACTRRSLRRFDAMMAVSPSARAFAEASFGTRSVVVPNMVDGAAFARMATSAPLCGERPHLVFVGNLVPRKGVATLVDALELLHDRWPDARLTIAGEGSLKGRLMTQASRAGLGEAIRFVGAVSEAEKAFLLADADVACFPSLYGESFGIVLLEAAAAGGIAVAAANRGYAHVLQDVPEALFRPGDARALAAAIGRMLSDGLRRERARRRQAEIAERHDIDVVTARVLEVYDVARRRRNGRAGTPRAHETLLSRERTAPSRRAQRGPACAEGLRPQGRQDGGSPVPAT